MTGRSPAGSASGAVSVLAGCDLVTDEDFPTAARGGRKANPIDPERVQLFEKLHAGTVRWVRFPAEGTDASAPQVTSLKANCTSWLAANGLKASHRGQYTVIEKNDKNDPTRVAFRIVSREK